MGYTTSKDDEITLPDSFKPTEHDVIVGWARQNYHHEGNQLLREIVRENVQRYINAQSKHDKGAVIVEILERLQRDSPSGYGLVRQHPDTGRWHYIGTDKAKDKIGHALRKAARDYEKSNPEPQTKSTKSSSSSSRQNGRSSTAKVAAAATGTGTKAARPNARSSSSSSKRHVGQGRSISSANLTSLDHGPTFSRAAAMDRSLLRVTSMPVLSTGDNDPPIPAQVTVPSSPVRRNSSTSLHSLDDGIQRYSSSYYHSPHGHFHGPYGAGRRSSRSHYTPPSHLPSSYSHHPYNYNHHGHGHPSHPPPHHSHSSQYDPGHYGYHYHFHHQHDHHHHHHDVSTADRAARGDRNTKDGYYMNDTVGRGGYGGNDNGVSSSPPRYLSMPADRPLASVPSSQPHHSNDTLGGASSASFIRPASHPPGVNSNHCNDQVGPEVAFSEFDPIPVSSTDLSRTNANQQHPHAAVSKLKHEQTPAQRGDTHRRTRSCSSQFRESFGGATFHALDSDDVPASAIAAAFEPDPYPRSVSENESFS